MQHIPDYGSDRNSIESNSGSGTGVEWFKYAAGVEYPRSLFAEKPVKIKKTKTEKPKQPSSHQFNPLLSFVKLFVMIKKDFKLLTRSRASALIVLLGPLAIILLVGFAFNSSSLYNIRIASYSESYSDLSNSITSSLQDQQYSVTKVNSIELCKNGVKYGDYHICVIFPKDLNIGNQDNTITIFVDQSRTNLASLITNTITEKVASKSTELGISLTTDMLSIFEKTKKAMEEKKKKAQAAKPAASKQAEKPKAQEAKAQPVQQAKPAEGNMAQKPMQAAKPQ